MTAADIIESAHCDGVEITLRNDDRVLCAGDETAVARWVPIFRENKAAILDELRRERRCEKVLAMLTDGRMYSVLVEDATTDPVIATIGIRGTATFEMEIPLKYYNGMALLELIETLTEPSQSCGEANTSHSTKRIRQGHYRGRTA